MRDPAGEGINMSRWEGGLSEGQLEGCRCLTASEREDRVTGSNCWRTAGWGRGEWGDRGIRRPECCNLFDKEF